LTLDAGALIAFDRGDERLRALVRRAVARKADIAIPAGALAQAWRDGSRQARLAALIGDPRVRVEALTEQVAKAAGVLSGRTSTRDIVNASVVLCARRQAQRVVITADPRDISHLDPHLAVESV
jgi:hypothetical protein